MVAVRPSRSETFGTQSRAALAALISGWRTRGSSWGSGRGSVGGARPGISFTRFARLTPGPHRRAIGVEDPRDPDIGTMGPSQRGGQGFGKALGLVVHRPGPDWIDVA